MKLLTLLILILSFAVIADDKSKAKPKNKLIARNNHLMKLVNSEIALIEPVKQKRLNLRYRLFELYSEKLGLIRQREHTQFFKTMKDKKSKYRKSASYLAKTQKFGKKLLARARGSRYQAQILFTLGLNERDYGNPKLAIKYLKKALNTAKRNKRIKYKIQVVLAEHYYNEKKYRSARKEYKQIIKNKHDKWHLRHVYNYAWCVFKQKKYAKATRFLLDAYQTEAKQNYVTVNTEVENSIGLFYLYAGAPAKAFHFYKTNLKDPFEHYYKLLKTVSNKGKLKDLKEILSLTETEVIPKVQNQYIPFITLSLELLRAHKQYALIDSVLSRFKVNIATIQFKKSPERESFETELSNFTGYLRLQLTKNFHRLDRGVNQATLQKIQKYYQILAQVIPEKTLKYNYFRAETYSSVHLYSQARPLYKEIVVQEKTNKNWDRKLIKKTFDSLFFISENEELTRKQRQKLLLFSYSEYLSYFPKSYKSSQIYQNLLALQWKKKMIDAYIVTIDSFHKNYPGQVKQQQGALHQYLKQLLVKKDIPTSNTWLKKVQKGYLSYDISYIKNYELSFSELVFSQTENLEKSKQHDKAYEGYLAIYQNQEYPKIVKDKSLFKLAELSLLLGAIDQSWKWLAELYKDKELLKKYKKNLKYELSYIDSFILNQAPDLAQQHLERLRGKYCGKPKKVKELQNKLIQLPQPNYSVKSLKHWESCQAQMTTLLEVTKQSYLQSAKTEELAQLMMSFNLIADTEIKDYFTAQYIDRYFSKNNHKQFLNKYQRLMHETSEINEQFKLLSKSDEFLKTQFKSSKQFELASFQGELQNFIDQFNTSWKELEPLTKQKNLLIVRMLYQQRIKLVDHFLGQIRNYEYIGLTAEESQQIRTEVAKITRPYVKMQSKTVKLSKQIVQRYDIIYSSNRVLIPEQQIHNLHQEFIPHQKYLSTFDLI